MIFLSTLIDYVVARRISIHRQHQKNRAFRWLLVSVVVNLTILGFFKYFNFFIDSFLALFASLGLVLETTTLQIILPIGISFYTFQTLSYSIDVWRGRQTAEPDFINFALFVAFFPQLMAGPIERAKKLLPQIQLPRTVSSEDIGYGSWLILWGLFKKVWIADNLARFTGAIFNASPAEVHGGLIYLALFAFVLQLYCDFSGYSDMARGIARLMGFRLSINFNLPYFASSPAELWRRWHITLSNWFRDYLYASLRKLTLFNLNWKLWALLPTMALVGLWHGANWTFVVWGCVWGIILIIDRIVHPQITIGVDSRSHLGRLLHYGGILLTFQLWMLSGLLFCSPSLANSMEWSLQLLNDFKVDEAFWANFLGIIGFSTPLFIMQFAQHRTHQLDLFLRSPFALKVVTVLILLVLMLSLSEGNGREFFYFQF
ncbi:MBOAT family protein [Ectothiorhodospiraceae bacterium BW-2]|nr:MBOAT family protein [Ectothiorhodospiraceae bacterium BW-2]